MAFYKLCDCGKKNVFENRGLAPRRCESCGRSLLDFSVADEDDEHEEVEESQASGFDELSIETFHYTLEDLCGNYAIAIPPSGGIVGRAALGAENLEANRAISREHIRVSYRGHIGLLIEDISRYGTFLNDERLVKGTPKFAHEGDMVTLYDLKLKVKKYDGV